MLSLDLNKVEICSTRITALDCGLFSVTKSSQAGGNACPREPETKLLEKWSLLITDQKNAKGSDLWLNWLNTTAQLDQNLSLILAVYN